MKKVVFICYSRGFGDVIAATATIRKIIKSYKKAGDRIKSKWGHHKGFQKIKKLELYTHHPDLFKYDEEIIAYHINQWDDKYRKDYVDVLEIHKELHSFKNNYLKHNQCDIRQIAAHELGFTLLPEEMTCVYYSSDTKLKYDLPEKYLVVHAPNNWGSRTYAQWKWQELITNIEHKLNIPIVLIGKDMDHKIIGEKKSLSEYNIIKGIDLQNKTSLDETWHIMNNSLGVITTDSGILHFAGTTDTYIFYVGGPIHPKLRMPYRNSSQDYKTYLINGTCEIFCGSDQSYSLLEHNEFHSVPKISQCLESIDHHGNKSNSDLECHPLPNKIFDVVAKHISEANLDINNHGQIDVNFINGAFCEISKGTMDNAYMVEFIDKRKDDMVYLAKIKSGNWARTNPKYFIDYLVRVKLKNKLIFEHNYDCSRTCVFIWFDSSAIGDTLAWIPYVEEFRKKHNCEVVCSTFHNNLVKDSYSEITFVEPGSIINGHYAEYKVGWFYKEDKNPNDTRIIPLQQTASDILGLEHKEIKPKIKLGYKRPIKEKYVCISTQSTAQAKYWNVKNGWEKVVDYIKKKGYKVVCIDKSSNYGNGECFNKIPKNAIDDTGNKPLERRIQYLEHADFYIGLGSGLSWLAWACNTKTVLISSFSKPFCEFKPDIRLYNDNEKSGYLNDLKYLFDAATWNWNPIKNCETLEDWYDMETITVEQVKEAIDYVAT